MEADEATAARIWTFAPPDARHNRAASDGALEAIAWSTRGLAAPWRDRPASHGNFQGVRAARRRDRAHGPIGILRHVGDENGICFGESRDSDAAVCWPWVARTGARQQRACRGLARERGCGRRILRDRPVVDLACRSPRRNRRSALARDQYRPRRA